MNTDNMSILGLTLDYGPYGFLDQYDPGFICNHSDHHGRYAFDQQPGIALWNLTCLAQTLTPLMSVDAAKACLEEYEQEFVSHYYDLMRLKLGLPELNEQAVTLVNDLLDLMQRDGRDYTLTLRALSQFRTGEGANNQTLRDRFISRINFDQWARRYAELLIANQSDDVQRQQDMNRRNPKYILRNYLAQIAIDKARLEQDYSEIDRLLTCLRDPFSEQVEFDAYAGEPPDWAARIEVSCSS